VLILALIGFGALVGALAQFIVGRSGPGGRMDWGVAIIAGLAGSFIGGLLASLLNGDGLALRPSGIIGSLVGAIIITLGVSLYRNKQAQQQAAARKKSRSGNPAKRG
jgi:uncharacterized membrane protein YeaQ/YmgE (transglycosylase-associated protein family)